MVLRKHVPVGVAPPALAALLRRPGRVLGAAGGADPGVGRGAVGDTTSWSTPCRPQAERD